MPDPAPLLAAIASNPDDDLPRLVYADWLDEQGDPDRAEFIRLQCHTVRVGPLDPSWAPAKLREYDLFKANEARWRPGRRDDVSFMHMTQWVRGFPACIDLADVSTGRFAAGEWCNGAFHWTANPGGRFDPWPAIGPVREVRFSGWRPGSGGILRTEQLRSVRSLSLMEWYAGVRPDDVENFAVELAHLRSGHFPELTTLDLSAGELNLHALEALSVAPAARTLTHLRLRFPHEIPAGDVTAWRTAAHRLFEAVAPRLERLTLHAFTPELIVTFTAVAWPQLRSLSLQHTRSHGLGLYDFSNLPNLAALTILHQSGAGGGRFAPNPLEAFDDGWPDASLKVLALGPVPADELRPWLAYPERFSLDFLSARVSGGRLRMEELTSYPLTRGLKGVAGAFTNHDLAPLADPTELSELHTVWCDEPQPLANLRWRGGTRTVVGKDKGDDWRHPPTRGHWCAWGDALMR